MGDPGRTAERHPLTARFIVLEGVDGSGKTLQAARLATWLRSRGRSVFECADGAWGVWGAAARAWLQSKPQLGCAVADRYPIEDVSSEPEYLLACFVKSRRELSERIADALAAGRDVVCDRWEPSTWAYQIAAGVPTSRVLHWVNLHPPLAQPDLVLWLRVPPARALLRVQDAVRSGERSAATRFETVKFLAEVASCYEGMPGMVRVDASQPLDDVTDEVVEHVAFRIAPEAFA